MSAEQARNRAVYAVGRAFFDSPLWFVWCGEDPLRIVNDGGILARDQAAELGVATLEKLGWRGRPERDASSVIVFDLWRAEPVFHLTDRERSFSPRLLDDRWTRNEHRVRCGRLVWAIEWRDVEGTRVSETRGEVNHGTYLRRDHAEQIGRLCERCAG